MLDASRVLARAKMASQAVDSLGVFGVLASLGLITGACRAGSNAKSLMFGPVKYYCPASAPQGTGLLPGSRPEDEIPGIGISRIGKSVPLGRSLARAGAGAPDHNWGYFRGAWRSHGPLTYLTRVRGRA